MLRSILAALLFLSSVAQAHQDGVSEEAETAFIERVRTEQNEHYRQLQEDLANGVPFDVASDSCKYISSIFTPPVSRVVTLTFDDGPSSQYTPIVLDVLKAYGVKATFFMKGSNAAGKDKILKRIKEEGHIIANHSYSHANFHELSKADQISEVSATDGILKNYMPDGLKLFRYPYGNSTCYGNSAIKNAGYAGIVGWHIDSCDWAYASKGYVTDKQANICGVKAGNKANFAGHVIAETKRRDGGIILMHDIHQHTANSVKEIIVRLQREGFSFANLDQPAMKQFFR